MDVFPDWCFAARLHLHPARHVPTQRHLRVDLQYNLVSIRCPPQDIGLAAQDSNSGYLAPISLTEH